MGAMEVTSKKDFFFYIVMSIPMYATLSLLNWKLSSAGVDLLDSYTAYGIYIAIWSIFLFNVYKIYDVNKDALETPIAKIHQYQFKQVAILDLAYMVTFGSELAVVSMLPLFFFDTFSHTGITPVQAGLLASGFAFMNLLARPSGGLLSDKFGRKHALTLFLIGSIIGYLVLSQINSHWPIMLAVLVTMMCSFFVQAGEGAVFAMVPLIKRRMTGQIAGMVGAYGNIGGVIFLTILSFVSPALFFSVIAGAAFLVLIAVQFLDEPQGHTAEILPDGTVQMIKVD
jgi:NNP family nitrate/nitrite transporter-like MFS transporter